MSFATCKDGRCTTCIGVAMIIGSIVIYLTTQHHYISTYHDINTIHKTIINMNDYNFFKTISDSDAIYISDILHLSSDLQHAVDVQTGVIYKGFVLRKEMEMYSWIQKKSRRKIKGRYNYVREWSSTYHNNANFKYSDGHYNPQNNQFMSFQQEQHSYCWSDNIMLGKYHLSNGTQSMLIEDKMSSSSWNDITDTVYHQYYSSNSSASNIKNQWTWKNGYIYWSNNDDNNVYRHVNEPNIGDLRIKYSGLDLSGYKATFLGSIINSHLTSYYSENKKYFSYLKVGSIDSIHNIITSFHLENDEQLYPPRCITLIMMCFGSILISSYYSSYIPLYGGNLKGMVLNIVTCIYGVIFWLTMVGIGYLFTGSLTVQKVISSVVIVVLFWFLFQKTGGFRKERKEGQKENE